MLTTFASTLNCSKNNAGATMSCDEPVVGFDDQHLLESSISDGKFEMQLVCKHHKLSELSFIIKSMVFVFNCSLKIL